jgi:hypothetical protein
MSARRLDKKRFSFLVDSASIPYSKKFDLDRNIRVVTAILMTSNKPHLLFYRGSQRIEISSDELFPEGYESKLLMSGLNVPPNEKFEELGEVMAGNGELKVLYKDTDNNNVPFEPYEVSIYLKVERIR